MADISQIQVAPNQVYDIKDATARRTATTSQTGQVKPDGTTVTVDEDGTIHSAGGGGGSLPAGGTAGQILTKQSSTAGDATWVDPPLGEFTDTQWTNINTILR